MTEENVIEQLARLSERQREVLRLVCEGLDYKTISRRLSISVPTVKTHMQQVYVRLDLKRFYSQERLKVLFEEYCPVLRGGLPPPPGEPESLELVPIEVQEMVDEDERALALWQNAGLPVPIKPETMIIDAEWKEAQKLPRRAGLRGLVIGVVLGALLTLGTLLLLGQLGGGIETAPESAGATPQVIVAQVTVLVTPTPDPDLSTGTPLVQEVVVTREVVITQEVTVVVTATPAATDTPTPSPNTLPGTRLKVGETWKQDGFYLTLNEVSMDTYFGQGRITLKFDVANHTGDTISVELDRRNITVTANNGTQFQPAEGVIASQLVWNATLADGDRADVYLSGSPYLDYLGDYFSANVSYILVTVRDWSRISEAMWQIDIQH